MEENVLYFNKGDKSLFPYKNVPTRTQEFIQREQEIREATKAFPGIEIGEAYTRWKLARGEKPTFLTTRDKVQHEEVKHHIHESAKRPCTQINCLGTMILEAVCNGCVEGKKGYKSKWTCEECLHRELSKKEYMEWLKELSGSLKESS